MNKGIKLQDSVDVIKGVGVKKQLVLEKMEIFTIYDLLEHFPIRYQDRTKPIPFQNAEVNKSVLVSGELLNKRIRPIGGGRTLVEANFIDESGIFRATFFNMPFIVKNIDIGHKYVLFGNISFWKGTKSITNPEIAEIGSKRDIRGIIPVYRRVSGISSNEIAKLVSNALEQIDSSCEWIDEKIREKTNICEELYAYKNIHFPQNKQAYNKAKYRLIYDHILTFQYAIKKNRRIMDEEQGNYAIVDKNIDDFINYLPFKLTSGQFSAIKDIEKDLVSSKPMNRLIQGDVGCGKTVVAEAAIFKVLISGMQAAFMAPTEILARQHYDKISKDFKNFGYKTALLISGMKASEREELLIKLSRGEINILIGTHALIQNDVKFLNLGLVITDEQHRFGVNQRKLFSEKSSAANILVMSATPIPRTLATTVYGDMDFSVIKNRPANRKVVITRSLNKNSRERAYIGVENELKKGNKAFIVAPSIEDDEDSELFSANKLFKDACKRFKGFRIGLMHGQLNKNDKEEIMNDFVGNKLDVLVSTVVIEVGIDIPEATIIVIENAERFGLAQLHQLRGRVGRNSMQSYCYLINYSDSENSKARMEAMVKLSDGFEISEEDYRLRGAGDIMGTIQSGNSNQNFYRLFEYREILEAATLDAEFMVENTNICDLDKIQFRINKIAANDNSNII